MTRRLDLSPQAKLRPQIHVVLHRYAVQQCIVNKYNGPRISTGTLLHVWYIQLKLETSVLTVSWSRYFEFLPSSSIGYIIGKTIYYLKFPMRGNNSDEFHPSNDWRFLTTVTTCCVEMTLVYWHDVKKCKCAWWIVQDRPWKWCLCISSICTSFPCPSSHECK